MGLPTIAFPALQVIEIDLSRLVCGRGDVDDPGPIAEQRVECCGQGKVAEVVDAQLQLKAWKRGGINRDCYLHNIDMF